jgi:hypothetical protein
MKRSQATSPDSFDFMVAGEGFERYRRPSAGVAYCRGAAFGGRLDLWVMRTLRPSAPVEKTRKYAGRSVPGVVDSGVVSAGVAATLAVTAGAVQSTVKRSAASRASEASGPRESDRGASAMRMLGATAKP